MAEGDNINPVQLQKYLKGVDYPARKDDLILHARQSGADDMALLALQRMRRDSFNSPNDVSEALKQAS